MKYFIPIIMFILLLGCDPKTITCKMSPIMAGVSSAVTSTLLQCKRPDLMTAKFQGWYDEILGCQSTQQKDMLCEALATSFITMLKDFAQNDAEFSQFECTMQLTEPILNNLAKQICEKVDD